MKISLLIGKALANKIKQTRQNLYNKGFRVDEKKEVGEAHIKLAEATPPPANQQKEITNKIEEIYNQKYKNEVIKNFELVNEPREISNWVALQINEKWLQKLSKDIEAVLDEYGINQTEKYKLKIKNIRNNSDGTSTLSWETYIADHLNLLNKCKKEKADEADEAFEFLKDVSEIKSEGLLVELD